METLILALIENGKTQNSAERIANKILNLINSGADPEETLQRFGLDFDLAEELYFDMG